MYSLVGTNIDMNTKDGYEQNSYNLKEKDKNYLLYHS